MYSHRFLTKHRLMYYIYPFDYRYFVTILMFRIITKKILPVSLSQLSLNNIYDLYLKLVLYNSNFDILRSEALFYDSNQGSLTPKAKFYYCSWDIQTTQNTCLTKVIWTSCHQTPCFTTESLVSCYQNPRVTITCLDFLSS